jgi:alkylation response protein AidB-like acyl-CoA dehydrogenase
MALKGGSFIIGQGNPKDIFIREEFTEEQRSIAEMVKEFCIKEIQEPMMKRGRELEATKDREEIVALLEKSAELGFCGVSIAEEFGGMDLDFNTGLVFGEQIALRAFVCHHHWGANQHWLAAHCVLWHTRTAGQIPAWRGIGATESQLLPYGTNSWQRCQQWKTRK